MKKTLVSIIVPVYNREKFLTRCLDSLINQTLKDIEIICIDDGSTDKSVDILTEYQKKDERVKIILQNQEGVSAARNKGIDISTGDYLGFVDSDDYVDKDFYEKLYKATIETSADVACAGIIRKNEKKCTILADYVSKNYFDKIRDKFIAIKYPANNYVVNKIYSRSALNEANIRFQEGVIYEDLFFTPSVIEKLGRVVVVANTNYHYWKHKNSIIKQDDDKARADCILANRNLRKYCKKYNLEQNKKWQLHYKKYYCLFGLKILQVCFFRATKKYILLGIPILEVRKK